METIRYSYGRIHLLTKEETEFEAGQFYIASDEFGQFFATKRDSGQEVHMPRTNAIASLTIESHRFSSASTRFGNEMHKETENGKRNVYNRVFDLDKAKYKEIRFVFIGHNGMIYTGRADLIYPLYGADPKSGKEVPHYFYQGLGYAYAFNLDQYRFSYYDTSLGASKMVVFPFLREQFKKWELRYSQWVKLYNDYQSLGEKEKIIVRLKEIEKIETFERAKKLAQLKSLQRLVNEAVDKEESKIKDELKMLLNGKKLSVFDHITEESVEFSTSKSGVLSCRGKFDLPPEEVNRLLFGEMGNKEENFEDYAAF